MWMDNWALNIPKDLWAEPVLFRFFVPSNVCVVLSSSNKVEIETCLPEVHRQNRRVLRRKGGGGTVVLSPGCLVLTFAFYAKDIYSNSVYFGAINALWAKSLAAAGLPGIVTLGISDLAINGKKIAGTSLFRRKHLLVYQASLLVDPDFAQIESLLAHPSREPDYRAGRSHRDFLTTTKAEGCKLTPQELAEHCQQYFKKHAAKDLESCLLGTI